MRFAVIGCGVVSQVMHIPYLTELPEPEIHALVDPARERAETLAARYNVPNVYTDHTSLLDAAADEIHAVVVLTPSHTHADIVVDTLEAGIHTLVEKPLAATPAGAERMVEAERGSDATAMVAYMKRYDPAYEATAAEIDGLAGVDLVTAYDVDPDHARIIDEVYDLVESGSPPDQDRATSPRRVAIRNALGTDDAALVDAYDFQIEHVCHDVNVLRGLFGAVEHIDHVDMFADGRYATAHLRYEDGVRCVLQSGDSDRKWFEEFVRVDGPDGAVELGFSNPFIKNTPSELRVERGTAEYDRTVRTPSYEEPFKRELDHFVTCVTDGERVRTPFAEAAADIRLIAKLFARYRDEGPAFAEG